MKFKKLFIILFTLLFCLTSCNKEEVEPSSSITPTEYFEVNWKVEDTIIKTEKVKKGKIPKYTGEIPTKEATQENYYKFSGWQPTPNKILEDTTYTATFTDAKNIYTIKFDTLGGSSVNPISREYGSIIMKNNLPVPKKQGLHFTGWTLDKENTKQVSFPYKIVEDTTFFASYSDQIENVKILNDLLANYSIAPYKLIPTTIQDSSYLITNDATLNYDYSKNKKVSELNEKGLFEGYKNILQILNETNSLANQINFAINLVGGASSLAYSAYIEGDPVDINNFEYSGNGAKVSISIINENLTYLAEFNNATINLSALFKYNTKTKLISASITLNKDHKVKYYVKDDELTLYEHNLAQDRYIHIKKDEDNIVNLEINDINAIINNTYKLISNENETVIISNLNNSNLEVYDTKTGRPLFLIQKGLVNKILFNLGDTINGEATIRKENDSFIINEKEFKIPNGLTPSYKLELNDKYYPSKEGILTSKLVYKPHQLPMLNVSFPKLDTIKDDIKTNNPELEFNLTISIDLVKNYNSKFDDYMSNLLKIKNENNKDIINGIINE